MELTVRPISHSAHCLLIIFTICIRSSATAPPQIDEMAPLTWTHSMSLPSGMVLKWNIEDPLWITMEMSGPTRGYVGIGFSKTGGMSSSDIIMGWIDDDGKAYLKDYHGIRNEAPIEDEQQDLELISAEESSETGTKFVFRRKWETCDDLGDLPIKEDTMKLIWAMGDQDPSQNGVLPWHGKVGRGTRSIYMKHQVNPKGFPDDDPTYDPATSDIKYWDIKMDQYIIPKEETNYMCKLFKFPQLDKKHHIIAHRPIIPPESLAFVHHIIVFRCAVPRGLGKTEAEIFEPDLHHPTTGCHSSDLPTAWRKYCATIHVAIGVGSEGDILPDHLGDAIEGAEEGNTYFKLEVHYDNPNRLHLNDSTGIRMFYTSQLRQYEVAMLFAGHRRTPFMSIPPHQKNFRITGFCAPDCTRNGFPPGGIKIYTVLLHAHLTCRRITLRHIRDGKELQPVAQDNNYDFTYQQYRMLSPEATILAGDELVVECDFDTRGNDTFIYGGLSTSREMCEAFIFYYPKSALTDCRSQPELYSYLDAFQIQNVSGQILDQLSLPFDPQNRPEQLRPYALPDDCYVIDNGKSYDRKGDIFGSMVVTRSNDLDKYETVDDKMTKLDWRNLEFAKNVENQWINGPHYMHCAQNSGVKVDSNGHIKYPQKFVPYKAPPSDGHCGRGNDNTARLSLVENDGVKLGSLSILSSILICYVIHFY